MSLTRFTVAKWIQMLLSGSIVQDNQTHYVTPKKHGGRSALCKHFLAYIVDWNPLKNINYYKYCYKVHIPWPRSFESPDLLCNAQSLRIWKLKELFLNVIVLIVFSCDFLNFIYNVCILGVIQVAYIGQTSGNHFCWRQNARTITKNISWIQWV